MKIKVYVLGKNKSRVNEITFASNRIKHGGAAPKGLMQASITKVNKPPIRPCVRPFKAGGADTFEEELGQLLKKKPIVKLVPVSKLCSSIKGELTPIDTIEDIKWKIYKLTNIPIYAQCFYYKDILPYSITKDDKIIPINPEAPTISELNDIKLYDSLPEGIKIKSLDHFTFISTFMEAHNIPYFNLLNMSDYIPQEPLPEFIEDKVFISLVQILWPMTSKKMFHSYLNKTIEIDFPSIFKMPKRDDDALMSLYKEDARIKKVDFVASIRELVIYTRIIPIDLRILFDKLEIESNIAFIKASLQIQNRPFILLKLPKYKNVTAKMRNSVIEPTSLLIVLKTTDYSAKLYFKPHYYNASITFPVLRSVSFNTSKKIAKEVFNTIIGSINKTTQFAIPLINYKISQIKTISSKITIYKMVDKDEFKKVINSLNTLKQSGVLVDDNNPGAFFIARGIQFNPTIFYYAFDNSYQYLYDSTAKNYFTQYYTRKRVYRIMHRASDIQLRMTGLNEEEFNRFLMYTLKVFVNSDVKTSTEAVKNNSIIKLKREDPVLYDDNRYVYSKVCQNVYRPNMYSKEEYRLLPEAQKKKQVKYYNFTKKEETYYSCDKGEVRFLAEVHPNKYCVPCCGKQALVKGSERHRVHHECLNKHTASERERKQRRYVMNYGKSVPYHRISRIPPVLKSLIYEENSLCTGSSYYLYGLHQSYKGYSFGMLYCMSAILNQPIAYILKKISALVPCTFNRLLFGKITDYYDSSDALIKALNEGTGERDILNLVLLDIMHYIEIMPLLLIDEERRLGSQSSSGTIIFSTTMETPDEMYSREKFCIILKKGIEYYPIFYLDPDAYISNNKVERAVFPFNDTLIQAISSLLIRKTNTFSLQVLSMFCKKHKLKISEVFLNTNNKVYCAIISSGNKHCYIPMNTTYTEKVRASYTPFHRNLFTILLKYEILIINMLNKYLFSLNLSQITITKILKLKDKFIALRTSIGRDIPINPTNNKIALLDILEVSYDPVDVDLAISTNRKSSHLTILDKVKEERYSHQLYNMVMLSYIKYWRSSRNQSIRSKILSAIKSNTMANLIPTIEDESDVVALNKLVEEYFITGDFLVIQTIFKFTQYEFDKVKFPKQPEQIKTYLHKVAKYAVKVTSTPDKHLDNIIGNKKLEITKKDLDHILSYYAVDIANPLQKEFVTKEIYVNKIINELKFAKHDKEKLIVL